jgi:hypothetical protein
MLGGETRTDRLSASHSLKLHSLFQGSYPLATLEQTWHTTNKQAGTERREIEKGRRFTTIMNNNTHAHTHTHTLFERGQGVVRGRR